jgi:cytochrome P450
MSEHVRLAERFDHHDPEFSKEGTNEAVYRELVSRCPVAHSDAHGGFWAIAGYEELVAVANDAERFPKRYGLSVPGMMPVDTPDEELTSLKARIPANLDPPDYFNVRRIYNPLFSPPKAKGWEGVARELATRLIDDVIEAGECDLVVDVLEPFTGMFTLRFLGLPEDEWERFARPVLEALHQPLEDAEDSGRQFIGRRDQARDRGAASGDQDPRSFIPAVLLETARRRREDPRDDLLTHLATTTIDGVPLTDEEIVANAHLVLAGGVDTTIGAMSGTLLYLGRHPQERARLLEDEALMETAVEEFLRVFAPVTSIGRMAATDCELGGQQVRRGEPVLLLYPAANRDPRAFPNPEDVVLDRSPNRHVTFSAGIHRCPGSNFARMELRVVLEEVLRRLPDYRIVDEGVRKHLDISIIDSYARAPITFTPGRRERS